MKWVNLRAGVPPVLAGAVLAAALSMGDAQTRQGPAQQDCHAVSAETCAIANKLGRGINMGNMLEAPREGDWGVKLEPAYLDIAARHFQTVRLPVRWSNHAAPTADAKLDEAFARRVDQAVDTLLARGAYVILDMHHYNQLSGGTLQNHEFKVAPDVVEARFINMWRQIAERYKNRPSRLIFELLNEPHDKLDGEAWNQLSAKALAVVRESNPTRTVMIGPGYWNNVKDLPKLDLPKDRHLIVSFHDYTPFDFTHQGVTWLPRHMPKGKTCCDAGQRQEMAEVFDQASRWNREHGVPLHLGEFGAYTAGDMASRATWARLTRDLAEQHGIGWAWWEFGSDFSGVYSPETQGWVEPIRHALLDD